MLCSLYAGLINLEINYQFTYARTHTSTVLHGMEDNEKHILVLLNWLFNHTACASITEIAKLALKVYAQIE